MSDTPIEHDHGAPHVGDVVAAFALNALEPAERRRVERHCRQCQPCAQLLDDHRQVAGLLPFLAPPVTPGPDVKAALFARIAQADRRGASAPARRVEVPSTFTLPPSRAAESPTVERPAQRFTLPPAASWKRLPSVAAPLALIPLVVAVALGVWGMQLQARVDDRDSQMASLQAQLSAMDGLLASEDGIVYPMTAGPTAPLASGRIVTEPTTGEAMVYVHVEAARTGDTYPVYVKKDGSLVRAGEVQVNAQGNGAARLDLDEPFAAYRSVHVKAQPLVADDATDPAGIADLLSNEVQSSVGSQADGTDAPADGIEP